MPYIIIFTLLLIIVIIIFIIIKNKIKKIKNNSFKEILSIFKDYKYEKVKDDIFKFININNNKIFYLKLIYNFSNKEIVLNNRVMWEIKNPLNNENNKYIFLKNIEFFMNLEGKKIAIIIPNSCQILKYVNENEVVFVRYNTNCYDTRVMILNDLIKYQDEIKNNYLNI